MKWMLTVGVRWVPGNIDWQYKTVLTSEPPERWLMGRLETARLAEPPRLDACIFHAREISDEAAEALEKLLLQSGAGEEPLP